MYPGRELYLSLSVGLLLTALAAPLEAVAGEAPSESSLLPASSLEAPQAPTAILEPEVVLESYLEWFFASTNKRALKPAKKLIPMVVAAAQKEGLDPLLVAVIISCESTWNVKAVGASHGEVGLMQLHGQSKVGFDVTTIEGNLAAGCAWLASRIEKYGSVEAGVRHYIGFSSRAKRAATWRMKKYREALLRHGATSADIS